MEIINPPELRSAKLRRFPKSHKDSDYAIFLGGLITIDRALLHRHGRLLQSLGKGRMTVDGACDVLGAGAELNGQNALGDHVGRT